MGSILLNGGCFTFCLLLSNSICILILPILQLIPYQQVGPLQVLLFFFSRLSANYKVYLVLLI